MSKLAPPKLDRALGYYTKALEVYVAGVGTEHPKTAWAHEGIARVHMRKGGGDNFKLAQKHLDMAYRIRSLVQEKAGDKVLGEKEIAQVRMDMEALEARISNRKQLREKLRRTSKQVFYLSMIGGGSVTSVASMADLGSPLADRDQERAGPGDN